MKLAKDMTPEEITAIKDQMAEANAKWRMGVACNQKMKEVHLKKERNTIRQAQSLKKINDAIIDSPYRRFGREERAKSPGTMVEVNRIRNSYRRGDFARN